MALIHERRDRIMDEIIQAGHVTVSGLARTLEVSEATVRRDLKVLAGNRRVELIYGGAALVRNSDFSFQAKLTRNIEGKRIIGSLAAQLVCDSDQIFLDSGTTCFEMTPFLKRKRSLSIVANSTRLALELDTHDGSIILLGGQYRPERMDTVGPLATATLEQLRGYLAFMGADGLSREFGPTAVDIESAYLYRLAVKNARETVLVADHTKFQTPSLYKIVGFDSISKVVTDRKPEGQWMEFFDSLGIEVISPKADA